MRGKREEVCVAQDGELSFESEQVSFRGSIELSLFGSGVAPVALGDMTRDGNCREDERVGGSLGFALGDVANDAEDLASQGDRFLPHFEVPHAGCHAGEDAARDALYWYRCDARRFQSTLTRGMAGGLDW